MIRGIHGLFYSSDPDATRAFFQEKVQLPGSDIGGGWWIFDFAEGDLGVHPVDDPSQAGEHDISFYCDDIRGTVEGMKSRGVTFTKEIEDHGYGLVTYFSAPGGITVQLYEPRYQKGTSRQQPAKKDARKAARPAAKKSAAAKRAPATAAAKKAGAKKSAAKKASVKKLSAKKAPAKRPAKKRRK